MVSRVRKPADYLVAGRGLPTWVLIGTIIGTCIGTGVIIGGAFGAIVSSLVNDIIMPPIGLLLGRINFTDLFINLSGKDFTSLAAAKAAGAATLNYGVFINTIIDFLIVALVIFLVVRVANRLQRPEPQPAPTTKECPQCFTSIPIKATRCPNCTSQL